MSSVNWTAVNTVLLDMDGTLLDLRFDNYFWNDYVIEVYANTHHEPLEDARRHVLELIAGERGKLTWYCLDFWSRALRLDITALKSSIREQIRIREGTLAFLGWLRQQPVEIILCTNAHPAAVAIKLEQTGLEPWFDHIISSHAFGHPKEHPDFWRAFRGFHHFEPACTLMVDDSLPVLRAAHEAGVGQVVAVDKPDSALPAVSNAEFPMVTWLDELIPEAAANERA